MCGPLPAASSTHRSAIAPPTPDVYRRVGNLFRSRYGSHAGWAHSLLFAAELPQFSRYLPTELQDELKRNAAAERGEKKRAREEANRRREAKAMAKAAKTSGAEIEDASASKAIEVEMEVEERSCLATVGDNSRQRKAGVTATAAERTPEAKSRVAPRKASMTSTKSMDEDDIPGTQLRSKRTQRRATK